jgi:hypothetical protein
MAFPSRGLAASDFPRGSPPRRDRPQDLDYIRALLREATTEDVDEARDAVRLIEERGFARGRKLSAELEDLLGGVRR